MSCGCNSSPCNCQPRPSVCCTPTVESVEYTFENGNLIGIGVFDNDTDNLVQFRGIVSDSAALTVTLDPADVAIVLSFDQDALVADIPDADTTTRGILETATNAEAIAKAATNKILVPSNLAAIGASDTFAGLVELATDVETQAGISTTLAITPAGLASTYADVPTQQQFSDSVARNAAFPTTEGQIGFQLDADLMFVGFGTGVAEWAQVLSDTAAQQQFAHPLDIQLTIADFVAASIGAGRVSFNDFGEVLFTGTGNVTVSGGYFQVLGGYFDLNTTEFRVNTVAIPADRVLITSSTAGDVSSTNISNFLSSLNPQTGWADPAGTLDRSGFTAYNGQTISNPPTQAEVQAIDDAVVASSQHLAALITDLKARLLPAT
jgi:hypothetical protein